MKSFIITLIALVFGINNYAQNNNPFLKLDFDKVVMYDFEASESKGGSIVEENGHLTKTILKEVELDASTRKDLTNRLGYKKSFGGGTAACYEPHLGFVFFSKDKIVAHVTICMDCNRLISSLKLPNQTQHKTSGEKGWYLLLEGMSKTFLLFLNNLLKANGFSHQLPNERLH